MVKYFFLTYVWLVFENTGFVQCYVLKSVHLKKVMRYVTICSKSTWTQDAAKKYCRFLKGDLSVFIIIRMCMNDTKDVMVIISVF